MTFEYITSFSRNLGWVSENEQAFLKSKKVAIAGMGGVGGIYLLSCARLGIENFHISDFDTFEMGNFNRQVGSMVSTLDKSKSDTMLKMAQDINPNIKITTFDDGINETNVNSFLNGCDFYLDGMDLFEMKVRRLIFNTCHELGIPATTHGPLGMGTAYMTFDQSSPCFDDFFDFDSHDEELHPLVFLMGIAPSATHMSYFMDLSRINIKQRKVSSTFMGCLLCAGTAVTEMLKHLLDRGPRDCCPTGYHFDAYKKTYSKHKIAKGNKSLIQKLKIFIMKRRLAAASTQIYSYDIPDYIKELPINDDLKKVLDLGRWAPSGHNEQPIRLESSSSQTSVVVKVSHPTLSLTDQEKNRLTLTHFGIYFETVRIAATLFKYEAHFKELSPYNFELSFIKNDAIQENPLAYFIRGRFTDRRPYKTQKIQRTTISHIQDNLDPEYRLKFFDSPDDKQNLYALESKAFEIEMLDKTLFSEIGISFDSSHLFSSKSITLSSLELPKIINWQIRHLVKTPKIMFFMNKLKTYKLLDYIYLKRNAEKCGGFFSLERTSKSSSQLDYIQDGSNICRMWLTLTQNRIHLQPNYLLLFLKNKSFIVNQSTNTRINDLDEMRIPEIDFSRSCFYGRIGYPISNEVRSRSTRII